MAEVAIPSTAGGTVQCSYGVQYKSVTACWLTFTFTKTDVYYKSAIGHYAVKCPKCGAEHVLNMSATDII